MDTREGAYENVKERRGKGKGGERSMRQIDNVCVIGPDLRAARLLLPTLSPIRRRSHNPACERVVGGKDGR